MNSLLVLAPMIGVGIGLLAAVGVTRRNRRIHFVERDNIESELDDLDVSIGGGETCVECGDELDPGDVGAIVKEEGRYRAVCNKPECLDTYDLE